MPGKKLTGLAAEQLQVVANKLDILVDEMTRLNVLEKAFDGGPSQGQKEALITLSRTFRKIAEQYGKYVTSSSLNIAANAVSYLFGGSILGQAKKLLEVLKSDKELGEALFQLSRMSLYHSSDEEQRGLRTTLSRLLTQDQFGRIYSMISGRGWWSIIDKCTDEAPFLPTTFLELLDALVAVSDTVTTELFSQSFILKQMIFEGGGRTQEENIQEYKDYYFNCRRIMVGSISDFRDAFVTKKAEMGTVARAKKTELSHWKTTFDNHCRFMPAGGSQQPISRLEGHLTHLREQRTQLLAFVGEEERVLSTAQEALPAIIVDKKRILIDARADLVSAYCTQLKEVSSAADLKRNHLTALDTLITQCDGLLTAKRQAVEIADIFVQQKIKNLSIPKDAGFTSVEACHSYKNLILLAKQYEQESIRNLSAEMARIIPDAQTQPDHYAAIIQSALEPLFFQCKSVTKTASEEIEKTIQVSLNKRIQRGLDDLETEKRPDLVNKTIETLEFRVGITDDALAWLESLREETETKLLKKFQDFSDVFPKLPEKINSAIDLLDIEGHCTYHQQNLIKLKQDLHQTRIKLLEKETDITGLTQMRANTEQQIHELAVLTQGGVSDIEKSSTGIQRLREEERNQQVEMQEYETRIKGLTDAKEALNIREHRCNEELEQRIAAIQTYRVSERKTLDGIYNSYEAEMKVHSGTAQGLERQIGVLSSRLKKKSRGCSLSPTKEDEMASEERDRLIARKEGIEAHFENLRLNQQGIKREKETSSTTEREAIALSRRESETVKQVILREKDQIAQHLKASQEEQDTLRSSIQANATPLAKAIEKHAKLGLGLEDMGRKKEDLDSQMTHIIHQLNQLIKKRVEAQIASLKELDTETQLLLEDTELLKTAVSLPSQLDMLATGKFFKKSQRAELLLTALHLKITDGRTALNDLRIKSDSSELTSLQNTLDKAEAQLKKIETAIAERKEFLAHVSTISRASLIGEERESLLSTLRRIFDAQTKAEEESATSGTELSCALSSLKTKRKKGQTVSKVLDVLRSAQNTDKAIAHVPAFNSTSSQWHADLSKIKTSLDCLKGEKSAEKLVRVLGEPMAQVDDLIASIDKQSSSINELNKLLKELAVDAFDQVLHAMDTEFLAHQQELQKTIASHALKISQLSNALNKLNDSKTEGDEYLAVFFDILHLAGTCDLAPAKSLHDRLPLSERELITALSSAEKYHPDSAKKLKQQLEGICQLQEEAQTKLETLKRNLLAAPGVAKAACCKANTMDQYYQTVETRYQQFDSERADKKQVFDFFDYLWSSLLYIITLTVYGRTTEKNRIQAASTEILQSVKVFVSTQKELNEKPETCSQASADPINQACSKHEGLFPEGFSSHFFFRKPKPSVCTEPMAHVDSVVSQN